MKRLIVSIALLVTLTCVMHAEESERAKIGVVLSGGGAKGAAHIGVLRVLEEIGIPIDIIVGTSMGSIVGGLYAIGMSPDELDSTFMAQDWTTLLSDKSSREQLSLSSWERSSQFVLSFPFLERPTDAFNGGLIRGRNIGQMLWNLTEGYHDSIDFAHLPIPFACVAQDMVTGDEIVFHSGVLPIAIRSSMSIPGVFVPISLGNRLLIDGGIVNNYPVDVARSMGADIVIGIDVQDPLKDAEQLKENILMQLTQLIDLQGNEKWEKNKRTTDIYIKVDISGYNTASFTTDAIDTLIARGEEATRGHMDALNNVCIHLDDTEKIHDTLHMKKDVRLKESMHEQTNKTNTEWIKTQRTASLNTLIGDNPLNSINLGVRFDSEDLAALLFNCTMQAGKKRNYNLDFTLRIGKQFYADVHHGLSLQKKWKWVSGYRFEGHDFDIYYKGDKAYNADFHTNKLETYVARNLLRAEFKLGITYVHHKYNSFLYRLSPSDAINITREQQLKTGIECNVNTTNDNYFPTYGCEFAADYFYVIPIEKHKKTFHEMDIHWLSVFPTNSRLVLTPRIDLRYLTTENTIAEMNTLGGGERGKYFSQQIPFYGLEHFEFGRRTLIASGMEARQRILKRHYISIVVNMAATANDWSHFCSQSFGENDEKGFYAVGGALKYDLRTFIGPIGCSLSYSNRGKTSFYIRGGFNF